jgi:hypothetical protein
MFLSLRNAGFLVEDFIEPKILDEAKGNDLKLWKIHKEIPMFVIWMGKK